MKKRIFKILLLAVLAFFSFLMIRITLPYLAFEDNVGFLRIKLSVIDNQVWKFAFYLHVMTSCFVLLAGFTQFSTYLLKNYKYFHRLAGRLYVAVVLLLSGPAGFIMAIYANGGLSSRAAFLILDILWIWFTWQAYQKARTGDFVSHKNFMIRSFALTLSALTLRAWKYVIVMAFRPNPMDVYMIVAWLGWIPNIIIAEMYIRELFIIKQQKSTSGTA
jgi:uncharacterized membrane protein